jgi:hypothetical protein
MPSLEHLEKVLAWYASSYRIVSDLHSCSFPDILPLESDLCWVRRPPISTYLILNTFLQTILTSRYQAAKDVRASQDTLIDIFERMEHFFRRLSVYTEVTPTTEMMDIIMKIMVEVLTVLGIATKEMKQGRTSELFI